MKIARVQQKAGHDKQENVERGLDALDRAVDGGARLVAFAELAFDARGRVQIHCGRPALPVTAHGFAGLRLALPIRLRMGRARARIRPVMGSSVAPGVAADQASSV